jgi:hypothetical protein
MREIMSTTVKQQQQQKNRFEKCQVAPGQRLQKGYLAPEVKTANEIICDHVWDKLYPSIFVTCSKWYIRKAPFVLGADFGLKSAELLLACLISLLPERFGALSL